MKDFLIGCVLCFFVSGNLWASSYEGSRRVYSLDDGWRFHKGRIELPGRQGVHNWRYKLVNPEVAEAGNLDIPKAGESETGWHKGGYIRRGEDTLGQEWREGGNLGPKGSTFYAWVSAEIPGKHADRPALEFESINGIAH